MPLPALGPAAAAASAPPASPQAGARFGPLLAARLRPPPPPAAAPPLPLGAALRGVEVAQARLDAVVAAARRGQVFTAGELLALQAEAHRFTQALDVAGKLVEQGVSGLKQVLNTPL